MAIVRKVLLRPGVYRAPQGTLHATPERIRNWVKRYQAMHTAGIKIPVSWGHQPGALPHAGLDVEQDRARRQYLLSAYNAGYLAGMEENPDTGELEAVLDVPGAELDRTGNLCCWTKLPDGRQVKTAIGEVSAAIRNWRDGQGRQWDDSIVHVALTPLPVVAGQTGFQAVTTTPPPAGEVLHLGLADFLYELGGDMPDDVKDDDLDLDTPEETPAEEPSEGDTLLGEVKELLQAHGVHLPEDTDKANFMEHLKVALHALKEGKSLADREPDGDEPKSEDSGPLEQEQRPLLMSTLSENHVLRKLVADKAAQHKDRSTKLIDRLVRAQVMPPADAQRLKDKLESYELSLTEEGDVITQRLDLELSIWEKVYGLSPQARKQSLKPARIAGRPADRDDEKEMEEFARKRAERVSTGQ